MSSRYRSDNTKAAPRDALDRRRAQGRRQPHVLLLLMAFVLLSAGKDAMAQDEPRPERSARPDASTRPTLITRFTTDGNAADQLARVVADSLELTLRLAGVPRVERADYLMPEVSFEATREYYELRNAASAVYGAIVSGDTGGYRVRVGIWSRESDAVSELSREIDSVFGVFDLADNLALDIGREVVGRDLSLGTIAVENTDHLASFSVYVDGQLIARNQRELRVLAGKRTVTVTQPGPLGDQPIAAFNVDVTPENRTTVALEPPSKNEEAKDAESMAEDVRPEEESTQEPQAAQATPEEQAAEPSGSAATSSASAEDVPRGSLAVETAPVGATVLLDDEAIGTTPIQAFGVEAGRYELTLERELFRSQTLAVDVPANGTARLAPSLEVDTETPEIASALLRPASPSIASLAMTAVKAGYLTLRVPTTTSVLGFNSVFVGATPLFTFVDFLVLASLHPGSLLAHRSQGQVLTSGLNAALMASFPAATYAWDAFISEDDAATYEEYPNLYFIPLLASMGFLLYDMAFTPAAAQARNEERLAEVRRTGRLSELQRPRRRSVMVEAGAGALARAAFVQEVFRPFGRLELAAGGGLAALNPIRATPLVSLRAAARPWANHAPGLLPELSVIVQGETDLEQFGFSIGGGIGGVLALRRFELFWRSNYLYGFSTGRPGFRSSFGVSL